MISEEAESISTRTLLANALESVSTKDERDLITSYRAFITDIDKLQKKLKDKQNTLYVAIYLEKIKMTEVLDRGNTEIGVTQQPRSINVSIANIFSKVNPVKLEIKKFRYREDSLCCSCARKHKNRRGRHAREYRNRRYQTIRSLVYNYISSFLQKSQPL